MRNNIYITQFSVQNRTITYQRLQTNFILYLCSVYIKLLNANISESRKQRGKDFTENIGGYRDYHHHGKMYLKKLNNLSVEIHKQIVCSILSTHWLPGLARRRELLFNDFISCKVCDIWKFVDVDCRAIIFYRCTTSNRSGDSTISKLSPSIDWFLPTLDHLQSISYSVTRRQLTS